MSAHSFGELVVERRQDFFGDLRRPNAERPCLARELALARIVREGEVCLLFLADLHADERLSETGDAEILPRLDVRIPRERGKRLAWHGRIDIDGEDVAGSRLPVDRSKLRVRLAHRRDGLVDVLVGGRCGLDGRAVREVIAEDDVGADDDGRCVSEGLALLELRELRIGPVDRLEALGLDDLPIRLIHQVVGRVLPQVLLAIRSLVHPARRFSRTEARDLRALHVALECRIGRARQTVGGHLDIQRDLRPRLSTERVFDGWRHGLRRVLHGDAAMVIGYARRQQVFFYEIHEGDEDLGGAVLLAHERRFEPLEFFALVKKARTLLVDSYEENSLAEAIANELARTAAFTHVTDELLVASVNVDVTEEGTFLVSEEAGDRSVFLSRDDDIEN